MPTATERERAQLLEIARLYAALIHVVASVDDPALKAEIAALIWPLKPMEEPTMLKSLPTWLRAAVITGVQTFVGTTLATLLGVLGSVQEWVGGGAPPDLTAPAKVLGSALVALAVGIVTAVYRAVRPVENAYPEPPKP